MTDDPTFVFVHGSGSNGRGWANAQRELGLRGHRSVAVYLPACFEQDLATFAAQPSTITGVTAEETVSHVADVDCLVYISGQCRPPGEATGA